MNHDIKVIRSAVVTAVQTGLGHLVVATMLLQDNAAPRAAMTVVHFVRAVTPVAPFTAHSVLTECVARSD